MRQRREFMGVSQGKLGRHLGLTFSQIQKYEKGSNRIGAGRLFQIASYLGVQPGFFFEGLDNDLDFSGLSSVPVDGFLHDEIRALVEAYSAITDPQTRNSVLALVRSLTVVTSTHRVTVD